MTEKHYIDNKEFERIIFAYKDNPKDNEDDIIALFDLLITNILDSFNFKVDKDDAKQECFVLVLRTIQNFDKSKGSAFNYFTTVIVNNCKQIYTKDKRYQQKIDNYMDKIKNDYPEL